LLIEHLNVPYTLRGEQEKESSSIEEIVAYLKNNKRLFYDRFGVTRMGIFGSFIRDDLPVLMDAVREILRPEIE
jgi:hypothetical protein